MPVHWIRHTNRDTVRSPCSRQQSILLQKAYGGHSLNTIADGIQLKNNHQKKSFPNLLFTRSISITLRRESMKQKAPVLAQRAENETGREGTSPTRFCKQSVFQYKQRINQSGTSHIATSNWIISAGVPQFSSCTISASLITAIPSKPKRS